MKRFLIFVIIAICTLCIQSCLKRDSLLVSNYLCAYYEANSSSKWICDTVLDANHNLISINITPSMSLYTADKNNGFTQITDITSLLDPETREAALFDSLSMAWNDHGYKVWKMERWSPVGPNLFGTPGAVITELTDIVITSNNEWGDSIPTGSNLNELFDITYSSFYPFINNNYNKNYLEEDNEFEAMPITKPLTELGSNDMKLLSISNLFTLTTKHLPQTPGPYGLTICAYDTDGTEYLRGSCFFIRP